MACMIKNKYQITYVLDLSPGCQELIDCGMLSGCHDFPHFWFTSIAFSRFKSPGCLFVNYQNHRNF